MIVQGSTYKIDTPVGTAFITINTGNDGEPFELFINIGKAGSDVAAMAEGLGRMVTLVLRMNSKLTGRQRLERVIEQLDSIGGARSLGFGDSKIRSLPDAIAKAFIRHFAAHMAIRVTSEHNEEAVAAQPVANFEQPSLLGHTHSEKKTNFDICPSCGDVSFAYEEGCKKCYSCGYSECG